MLPGSITLLASCKKGRHAELLSPKDCEADGLAHDKLE
jgi:hypothetical protein